MSGYHCRLASSDALRGALLVCSGILFLALTLAAVPASAGDTAAPSPIVSPDVPLSFVTAASGGGDPQVVFTTPKWTILLDYRNVFMTDADGPRIRKLLRRPTAGGPTEVIWDASHPGKGAGGPERPEVWAVYDDGAVLFSLGTELNYAAETGALTHWTIKINDEACLPVYGDVTGIVVWPLDATRAREAYYVPGQRETFDLDHRVKITGETGLRWAQPLFKRHGDRLVWLDWPSWDQVPPTRFTLASFNLATGQGWTKTVEVAQGNARLEHFDGHTVQVSGKRYDARTGDPK